jgi:hypothetical protein
MSTGSLDYCAVAALCGRTVADELYDRVTPAGVDLDFQPDQEAMAARTAERVTQEAKCASCEECCPAVVGCEDAVTQMQLHSVAKTL